MFAVTAADLGVSVEAALRARSALTVRAVESYGGHAVVVFDAGRGGRPGADDLPMAQDTFIEVGRASTETGDDAARMAADLWPPDRALRALSAWAADTRPLSRTMAYRLVRWVSDERRFATTDLSTALAAAIASDRPRWRIDEERPELDIGIVEYRPGHFVCGLRLVRRSGKPGSEDLAEPGPDR